MSSFDILIVGCVALFGLLAGLFVFRHKKFDEEAMRLKAGKMVSDAEAEGKNLIEAASDKTVKMKCQFEIEQQEFAAQLDKMEQMLATKSGLHQKREARNFEAQKMIQTEERIIREAQAQIGEFEKRIAEKLVQITGLSHQQGKEQLVARYEQDFLSGAEIRIQRGIEWAQECSSREARNILAETIYRFAESTSVEHGHRNIIVPRDEIKGRIVGRGGANIAFFENLFGVDVIFNDEPNTIIVACFNLVQREIARCAMERLMREKIINEEVITRMKPLAEQDIERVLRREGERALKIVGIINAAPEFARLVGRLRFRTSYGQNIMSHCFEVAFFARLIASEIGADTHVAWISGFFHDIGKAVDQETGGSHDVLSKEILEKYGFAKEIVHAAWTHHGSAPQESIEACIIQAADAISAGRPGARAESVERYLEKIKDLEETAVSFDGVRKTYAINAGRELRVIVEPEKINDKGVGELAGEIAAKVQEKGGYPGKIKIVTIRTTKVTDYAK